VFFTEQIVYELWYQYGVRRQCDNPQPDGDCIPMFFYEWLIRVHFFLFLPALRNIIVSIQGSLSPASIACFACGETGN